MADKRKSGGAAKKGGGDRRAVKKINDSMEKTTLGDLDVLSSLKSEMEEAEKGGSKSKK